MGLVSLAANTYALSGLSVTKDSAPNIAPPDTASTGGRCEEILFVAPNGNSYAVLSSAGPNALDGNWYGLTVKLTILKTAAFASWSEKDVAHDSAGPLVKSNVSTAEDSTGAIYSVGFWPSTGGIVAACIAGTKIYVLFFKQILYNNDSGAAAGSFVYNNPRPKGILSVSVFDTATDSWVGNFDSTLVSFYPAINTAVGGTPVPPLNPVASIYGTTGGFGHNGQPNCCAVFNAVTNRIMFFCTKGSVFIGGDPTLVANYFSRILFAQFNPTTNTWDGQWTVINGTDTTSIHDQCYGAICDNAGICHLVDEGLTTLGSPLVMSNCGTLYHISIDTNLNISARQSLGLIAYGSNFPRALRLTASNSEILIPYQDQPNSGNSAFQGISVLRAPSGSTNPSFTTERVYDGASVGAGELVVGAAPAWFGGRFVILWQSFTNGRQYASSAAPLDGWPTSTSQAVAFGGYLFQGVLARGQTNAMSGTATDLGLLAGNFSFNGAFLPSNALTLPIPSSNILNPGGRAFIKVKFNQFDGCLARDWNLYNLIDRLLLSCGRKPQCFCYDERQWGWEAEEIPTTGPPYGAIDFNPAAQIALPSAAAGDTVVLSFRVPTGYDGIILGHYHAFAGPGFAEGSGDLIWRLRADRRYLRDCGNMLVTMGSARQLSTIPGGLQLRSNDLVEYLVNAPNNSGNLSVGEVLAGCHGYFWPRK